MGNFLNRIFAVTFLAVGFSLCVIAGVHDDSDSTKVRKEFEAPEQSIVDEVIWVVGNEAIFKSDVERLRAQSEMENVTWPGNPDYLIPENIALQKLFVHQAAIDSVEVSESEVMSQIDQQIEAWVNIAGSREKLEEWKGQTISQMRQSLHDEFKNVALAQEMRREIVKDVAVTPADVRKYFKDMPEDSIPFVPTEVEVEIITMQPNIPLEEINRVKDELRSYTDRVTSGETSFATFARLYSDDLVSGRAGGELDYMGRGQLDPAFANVAFNLTDPKKISKIVESEFGYHIIQLIDKRGDRVKVRHILKTPKVSAEAMEKSKNRLDSIANELRNGTFELLGIKMNFEDAATYISSDKDTRNNHGLMSNNNAQNMSITSRFKMAELPEGVAREVEKLKVGEISNAFEMVNNKNRKVCAIIKLVSRTEGHRATITEDYQVMKNVVLDKEREKVLHEWVTNKIKKTYIYMKDKYKKGTYEYEGWVR
ncbi:MAG: peptidylprolyl isomerase [Prevotella sp.]|nr:peptidylprolyl isomerase [Prevotella sp.]MBQ6186446.1 peptidylprolyl isomerase [Prevotella sp.]